MIYTGTSGYSYKDWVGEFYPPDIKDGDMLKYYSMNYDFTEINSTYYKMPNYFVFKNLDEKTPESFIFTVKSFGGFTHSRDASMEDAVKFIEAVKPIKEKGKLGCLVFQFPYSFHNTPENLDHLKRVRDFFNAEDIVFEFRNSAWAKQETMMFLNSERIGWVSVDEPDIKGLIRPVVAVTSETSYVRFHGRNREKWYNHNEAYERYDYLYSEDELREWISRIKHMEKSTRKTFVAFNNHFRAQGAKNASMLKRLLNASK
jgi:uncharacterized protein YecE (DUF72 family)